MSCILVDTSVWIQFFRGNPKATSLADALPRGDVSCHPWILGELSLGNLGKRRQQILQDIRNLHMLPTTTPDEVMEMIDAHHLHSSGIGWVDSQLLAAALIADTPLWTLDRKLHSAAEMLDIAFAPRTN